MTVDWLYATLWLAGWGAFLIAAVALVRRGERRLSPGPRDFRAPISPDSGGSDPISAYLDRMTGELALPAADVAEVRAELADHLNDSIASLEAEGMDRETAVREALGRLGPPAELGRQLRAAHQSTRRLLAGAGGGVFAAGGGFVLGSLGGMALAIVIATLFAAVAAILGRIGVSLPDLNSRENGYAAISLLSSFIVAAGAAIATRYAVRTSAGLSRRAPRTVALFWAAAAVVAFGWWAIFSQRGLQSWPIVAGEFCIPLVAAAGALVRIERPMPHVGRWALAVVLVSVIVLPLLLFAGTTTSGSGLQVEPWSPSDFNLDTVAPAAPAAWLPPDDIVESGVGDAQAGPAEIDAQLISQSSATSGPLPIAAVLANWRDLRFEAWHSYPIGHNSGPVGIDTNYRTPFTVQPAVVEGDTLKAEFHFERLRDARSWWVVLTGIAPDGNRYRLGDGTGDQTDFNGSAWDWLTAPQ